MEADRGLVADHPHLVLGQQLQSAGLAPAPVLEGVVQQDGNPLGHHVLGDAFHRSLDVNDARLVGPVPSQSIAASSKGSGRN